MKKGDKDAQAWNHVPLELMKQMGDPRFGWLQGYLMDKPKSTPQEGYTRHDTITYNMVHDDQTKGRLPNISAKVAQHYEDRRAMEWEELNTNPGKGTRSLPDLYRAHKRPDGMSPWIEDLVDSSDEDLLQGKPLQQPSNLLRRRDAPKEASLQDRIAQQRLKWRLDKAPSGEVSGPEEEKEEVLV